MGFYLLAAALMLTTGLLGAREWYVALGCWLVGSIAVPVGHGVRAGGEMGREAWRLRTRGVLVEGRRVYARTYEFTDVEGRRVYARTYEFTDVEGRTRRLTDDYASGERVEILHDPAPGRDTAQIGRRATGTLVFAGCVCLLSLVVAAALVAIGLTGPLAALDVIFLGL
ncbi:MULTISPECIES: hypothetical protein [Streptomyces]|uniref:hypothetical protein n=2 Tax=Streptomyces TaxID=1883 RepID=UPI001F1C2CC3|nr:hypothetical protein [Streptomyces sp. R527F]UIZ12619.1 hypothetical protein LZ559_09360 [Streptomyces sp. R527F]